MIFSNKILDPEQNSENVVQVRCDRDWPLIRHDPNINIASLRSSGFCRAVRLGSFPPVTADLRFWYLGLKSPAFQFYATDWLGSQRVQMMTLEQEGAYIRLVAYCWQHGTIPSDPEEAARLIGKGASTTLAESVLPMFVSAREKRRLTHDRLEEQRLKQEAWKRKSAAGGRKSAESRSKGGSTTVPRVVEKWYQPNGNIPTPTPTPTPCTDKEEDASLSHSALMNEIFEAWNSAGVFPRCLQVSDKRRQILKVRLNEPFFADNWKAAIEKVKASEFLKGINSTGWTASFDFFISRDAITKIMEGTYDNRNGSPASKPNPRNFGIVKGTTNYATAKPRLQREREAAEAARMVGQVAAPENHPPTASGG